MGLAQTGTGKTVFFVLQTSHRLTVLVEQFNANCPHCMAPQAPRLKPPVLPWLQRDAALKGKLKLPGDGARITTKTTVKMWKSFHKVPFPVFTRHSSAPSARL